MAESAPRPHPGSTSYATPETQAYDAHAASGRPRARAAEEFRRLVADDSRRSFLRMVSHELRTPLNAIIGFSEIIARELHGPINEPRYREHAEIVRDSGLKLMSLLNQIIDIARLESGSTDLTLASEGVAEVLAEAAAAVAEAAGARDVCVEVERAAPADRILCDRRGLKTALVALLDNAVAFSPPGAVVTVRMRKLGPSALIEIADRGEGFPQSELPRLMLPFEQGESALVRRHDGAGLGLPMARLLCRAMGGRLRLRSAPGQGATAVVRLPLDA